MLNDLVGALLRIIYDALFWARNLPEGGRERPLLIVLEEAHGIFTRSAFKLVSKGRSARSQLEDLYQDAMLVLSAWLTEQNRPAVQAILDQGIENLRRWLWTNAKRWMIDKYVRKNLAAGRDERKSVSFDLAIGDDGDTTLGEIVQLQARNGVSYKREREISPQQSSELHIDFLDQLSPLAQIVTKAHLEMPKALQEIFLAKYIRQLTEYTLSKTIGACEPESEAQMYGPEYSSVWKGVWCNVVYALIERHNDFVDAYGDFAPRDIRFVCSDPDFDPREWSALHD